MGIKKVLIIGSKGMLGGELVRLFNADKNYEVIGWDKEEINITDREEVREKILALSPQIIINATGYNAVDQAEAPAEFEQAKLLNGYAVGWLAEIAKEIRAIFINYSSDYVFNGERREGYKENDRVSPISNYGISKALGEEEVQRAGGRYYIIRLQKLFGKAGDSPAAKKSFFETMLELAKSRKEFDMVDDELANFTYAPDLATQTKLLIEKKYPAGIYHITNEGQPVTWHGAAKIMFALAGIKDIKLNKVDADKFPRLAKRPKYSVLLNTKLPALRPWDEALREFLNF